MAQSDALGAGQFATFPEIGERSANAARPAGIVGAFPARSKIMSPIRSRGVRIVHQIV
jgi:hypothetical protein